MYYSDIQGDSKEQNICKIIFRDFYFFDISRMGNLFVFSLIKYIFNEKVHQLFLHLL